MSLKIDGITVEQLREAYQVAAELVARYGDAHLPVFKRLYDEIENIDRSAAIKSVALNLVYAKNEVGRKE